MLLIFTCATTTHLPLPLERCGCRSAGASAGALAKELALSEQGGALAAADDSDNDQSAFGHRARTVNEFDASLFIDLRSRPPRLPHQLIISL